MQKKIVIIGATNYAQLIRYYLENDAHWMVCAFSVEQAYIVENHYAGIPLVPFESLTQHYPPSEYDIVLGIGYNKMNEVRKKLFFACQALGYKMPNYIHSSTSISSDIEILGGGNIIMETTSIQPFGSIDSGNLIWNGVSIAHNATIGSFNTIAGNASLAGFVVVGNNCFLGNSCTIRDRITLEDYTLVGSAAYVAQSTCPYDVVVPARSIVLENKKSTDML